MAAKDQKAAIGSFIMPLITALFAVFMPNVQVAFNYMIMAVYVANIACYIAMLAIFKKKKRENAARLAILFNLLAFCLFFTFPFIKALVGQSWLQVLLFIIFFLCIWLANYDQKLEVPLVFPPQEKREESWLMSFMQFLY